jgi:hypothetical protein
MGWNNMGTTRNGRRYWFEIIPDDQVRPKEMPRIAGAIAQWTCRDLHLDLFQILWFVRRSQVPVFQVGQILNQDEMLTVLLNSSAPSTLRGRFLGITPNAVYLRPARSPHTVAYNLLHEARHVWQHRQMRAQVGKLVTRSAEIDADDYAIRNLSRIYRFIDTYRNEERVNQRG